MSVLSSFTDRKPDDSLQLCQHHGGKLTLCPQCKWALIHVLQGSFKDPNSPSMKHTEGQLFWHLDIFLRCKTQNPEVPPAQLRAKESLGARQVEAAVLRNNRRYP